MKRAIFVLCLLAATVVLAAGGEQWGDRVRVGHVIDQTGDSAVITKFNLFTARDGYKYCDSIRCSSTKIAAAWTSPMQVRRVAVAASIDTTKTDTLHVDLGTNKTGVVYAVANLAWTRAQYIDTIVARFNAVTTLADTVVAQDSTTYIKLVGLIAMDNLEGDARWTLDVTNASTNLVESDSTFTTVKMVCDSMVTTINALVTVNDSVTAAVDGDTVYTVTADRPGWSMVFKVAPEDTTQDTVHIQVAKASSSYDTTVVSLPIKMWYGGWNSLMGDFVFPASLTTTKGYGTLDSIWFYLYKTWRVPGSEVIIAADSGTLPRTFHVALDTKADSLYGDGPMFMRIIQMDTATDTSGTRYHTLDWGLTATE